MAVSYHNGLTEEHLIKVVQRLAYELSKKEEMLKVMRWLIDLESKKQTGRFSYDEKVK